MRHIIIIILGLTVFFGFVHAQSIVVAVDLNTRDQIQIWRGLDYPTYQFIANTAIAEVDNSQLPILEKHGFICRIIDESPWNENYFVGHVPTEYTHEISDAIIWQKDAAVIIKIHNITPL